MINLDNTILTLFITAVFLIAAGFIESYRRIREVRRVRHDLDRYWRWLERGITIGTTVDTTEGKATVVEIVGKKRLKVEFISGPRDGEVAEVEE